MNYNKEKETIIEELNSNIEKGLSDDQVLIAREKFGKNILKEPKKKSLIIRFLLQFADPLIIILFIAAIVSIIIDPHEWIESLIIFIVILFNAILGIIQESNAEKSLEALKKMSAPNAKVIRNGEKLSIASSEIVVGDIVCIEAGDLIPSDGRILEAFNLQIDESMLTGESLPVHKTSDAIDGIVGLGDQKNMAFASTICTYGRGKMIITSSGMQNEVGKIADMLMESNEAKTPLQQKLAQISKGIGIMCLAICVVVFIMELITGQAVLEAFKTAVALAVAAIPEGLATVVTIVLAIGVTKMVKKNAIVKKLPAVETLGAASIVCSDKTGTLTQNKMTVVKTYLNNKDTLDFSTSCDEKTKEMLRYFTLCTDGEIRENSDGTLVHLGDPTETAMVKASYLLGEKKEELYKTYIRKDELAFDSDRKLMTVFYEFEGKIISITKGAPDVVLNRSVNNSDDALNANKKMAGEALRVLAVAIRYWDAIPSEITSEIVENDLTFIGLIGMIDPPRQEVKAAIAEAKTGGIRTIMITGDHVETARAIAIQLGIIEGNQRAITGAQLNEMSDEQLEKEIKEISVYARVAPEHKVRIVKMWQKLGKIVAMTGDGVNDSPALKTADIGCAMGITGTDVTKSAADMILTDDNFATIINAVEQGRGIYANIKRDVQFLLSSNIGEVLTIFLASFISLCGFNLGTPLLPVHLLWVNLITDSLPAFALGMEPVDKDIMKEKPREKNESFFANHLITKIVLQGIMIGGLTLTSYIIGNNHSHETGMTMAFMTLALSQLFHAFNVKSNHSIFHKQIFNNPWLWGSLGIGILLQVAVMYIPGINTIFELESLSIQYLAIAFALSLAPLLIMEVTKLIFRLRNSITKK